MRIGILALQGAFIEHIQAVEKLGHEAFEIRQKRDIGKPFDALIIPGGESTVIGRLMHKLDLFYPIKSKIEKGLPVFGTCAGMIVLAKEISGEKAHLGVMDISVKRNAYGRQYDSFSCTADIPAVSDNPIPLVFIRAPWIESVRADVDVLLEYDGHIVAARQDNMLVTSFHPELTDNTAFLEYFINMVK